MAINQIRKNWCIELMISRDLRHNELATNWLTLRPLGQSTLAAPAWTLNKQLLDSSKLKIMRHFIIRSWTLWTLYLHQPNLLARHFVIRRWGFLVNQIWWIETVWPFFELGFRWIGISAKLVLYLESYLVYLSTSDSTQPSKKTLILKFARENVWTRVLDGFNCLAMA